MLIKFAGHSKLKINATIVVFFLCVCINNYYCIKFFMILKNYLRFLYFKTVYLRLKLSAFLKMYTDVRTTLRLMPNANRQSYFHIFINYS